MLNELHRLSTRLNELRMLNKMATQLNELRS